MYIQIYNTCVPVFAKASDLVVLESTLVVSCNMGARTGPRKFARKNSEYS